MYENFDGLFYNFQSGYWRWMQRRGFSYFIALWLADNYGLFSNANDPMHGLETQFAFGAEEI